MWTKCEDVFRYALSLVLLAEELPMMNITFKQFLIFSTWELEFSVYCKFVVVISMLCLSRLC